MNMAREVRVRFAPSPTGYLHIGGARTALFNWLYARKTGGKFLLRIEDTDVARSGPEMVNVILDGLRWLGLHWDEEPVFQSSRFPVYQRYARQLIEAGKAYFCYCSPETLKQEREKAIREKRAYRYDGRCKRLSPEERKRLEEQGGRPKAIRFEVPHGTTSFEDHVHGSLTFSNSDIEDFVILRSDGIPTYHLAVVVDDREMGITHIIRGDDHISNTPKQVLLYEAFGWEKPQFAHVPLILGPDRSRLSKRHGATAISEYQKAGYLPQAMVNFLALLGWSPGDDTEIMPIEEIIRRFDLSGILPKNAVFDEKKLEWMNGEYIKAMPQERLVSEVIPFLRQAGLVDDAWLSKNFAYLRAAVGLTKERARRLTEFAEFGAYFFRDPETYDEKGVQKYWREERLAEWVSSLKERIARLDRCDAQTLEATLRGLAEEGGIRAAKLIHAVRLALTGFTVGPSLFELMEVLGRERIVRRLEKAISTLSKWQAAVPA